MVGLSVSNSLTFVSEKLAEVANEGLNEGLPVKGFGHLESDGKSLKMIHFFAGNRITNFIMTLSKILY